MKTSIFDMTFTLPPMIEMTQVEKEMPHLSMPPMAACPRHLPGGEHIRRTHENIHL